MTAEQASTQILAKQRLNRPVAPHLAIYKAQVTWYLSALNRVTGVILSGTFYAFGLAYLAAPALGWHLETASLVAAFASFPVWAKFGTKLFFSLPFTFHSFNGLRHLTWDTGRAFTNRQVQVTGWSVVGLTFVTSLLLAVV
ncbi:hypothetical protein BT93_L0174 [Corymbia citriodora subsp. variegata]|uniref:Succinate dehydrogenase subunit C n=1 Tax=Corymbia citriodora subsp. variegata TaxID=360336 RepID=A0A8T0CER0_CORYI|nr:hypothetical protein BT93_L0174 [Corymbia citriodora subsp. variegata]